MTPQASVTFTVANSNTYLNDFIYQKTWKRLQSGSGNATTSTVLNGDTNYTILHSAFLGTSTQSYTRNYLINSSKAPSYTFTSSSAYTESYNSPLTYYWYSSGGADGTGAVELTSSDAQGTGVYKAQTFSPFFVTSGSTSSTGNYSASGASYTDYQTVNDFNGYDSDGNIRYSGYSTSVVYTTSLTFATTIDSAIRATAAYTTTWTTAASNTSFTVTSYDTFTTATTNAWGSASSLSTSSKTTLSVDTYTALSSSQTTTYIYAGIYPFGTGSLWKSRIETFADTIVFVPSSAVAYAFTTTGNNVASAIATTFASSLVQSSFSVSMVTTSFAAVSSSITYSRNNGGLITSYLVSSSLVQGVTSSVTYPTGLAFSDVTSSLTSSSYSGTAATYAGSNPTAIVTYSAGLSQTGLIPFVSTQAVSSFGSVYVDSNGLNLIYPLTDTIAGGSNLSATAIVFGSLGSSNDSVNGTGGESYFLTSASFIPIPAIGASIRTNIPTIQLTTQLKGGGTSQSFRALPGQMTGGSTPAPAAYFTAGSFPAWLTVSSVFFQVGFSDLGYENVPRVFPFSGSGSYVSSVSSILTSISGNTIFATSQSTATSLSVSSTSTATITNTITGSTSIAFGTSGAVASFYASSVTNLIPANVTGYVTPPGVFDVWDSSSSTRFVQNKAQFWGAGGNQSYFSNVNGFYAAKPMNFSPYAGGYADSANSTLSVIPAVAALTYSYVL